MNSRDQILGRIRNNRPRLNRPLPEVPLFDSTEISLFETFRQNLERMGGLFLSPPACGDALTPVQAKIATAKVVCSTVPEIAGNRNIADIHGPQDLADVDF